MCSHLIVEEGGPRASAVSPNFSNHISLELQLNTFQLLYRKKIPDLLAIMSNLRSLSEGPLVIAQQCIQTTTLIAKFSGVPSIKISQF